MKKESGERWKKRVNVCFGKNDLRCVAGSELDGEIAYRTGKAIVEFLGVKDVIVGHDMRLSSHEIRDAFIRGIIDYGANAIDIGDSDTPGLYFASGFLKKAGGMITASHNPGKYNGIKLVSSGAEPIGSGGGLKKIRKMVEGDKFREIKKKGRWVKKDLSREYRKHVLSFVDSGALRGNVVIDGGNGMAGIVVPKIYKGLGVKYKGIGFKPDGNFPMHNANPIKPENVRHLQGEVKKKRADFGIAFDADMDRVVFVDERGRAVDPSIIAALLVKEIGMKGGAVVYNVAMSKIVKETARRLGMVAYRERVGHAFIKDRMRKKVAVFGAEHSAHYYYKKNFYADSGIITSLIVCEIFSRSKGRFSELVKEFEKYSRIPERNVKVKDKDSVLKKVEKYFDRYDVKKHRLDGVTMDFGNWWFNLRASNTEPLLRINVESVSKIIQKEKVKELLSVIKKG